MLISKHEERVKSILSARMENGNLRSRENTQVEFKQSFNKGDIAIYAKTMAAFSNNSGGYIIFGIKDSPRSIIGLQNSNFENIQQEDLTDSINNLFSPSINWELGSFILKEKEINSNGDVIIVQKIIGWIYTEESNIKPVIAQKNNSSEKIVNGDIFYRYRARTEKIKYAEMEQIINCRMKQERDSLFKVFEFIRNNGATNLGIVDYNNGKLSTPYGVDVVLEKNLIAKLLKKAKFIKEGSFSENEGIPVIKVTGNINLAEEVPVPLENLDETYPYIQKQLAEKLNITPQKLYALIWYFKMKESKKYHLEITTSKTNKTHKFSKFALLFLKEKIIELDENKNELNNIISKFNNRKK